MEPAQFWSLIGVVVLAAGTIVGVIITGRGAKDVAKINVAAEAYEQVMGIWKSSIEQLQVRDREKEARIASLEEQARVNTTWRQVAVNHILELHSYMQRHLPGADDIPQVPRELQADIPPFRRPN